MVHEVIRKCIRTVDIIRLISGADPGFVERRGAAATASAAGAKVFGGSRLKTLFGISKGGARAPCAPPGSASGLETRGLTRKESNLYIYHYRP